jgi:carboxyl-terminal processing protease
VKRLPIFLYLHLAFALVAGAQSSPTAAAKAPAKKSNTEKIAANSASDDSEPSAKLASDPETEANIAKAVGCLLERFHYSQHDFDDEVSGKFLDRYFENLDGLHLHFLQSDIDEFSSLRTSLDDLTMRANDTSPAHKIFDRFMQRVEQRVAYAEGLLKTEKFEFKGNDRYLVNRKNAPRPKNLEEAKALWRQHLRFEYLQEKLSRREKSNKKVTLPKSENSKKLTPHEEIVKTLTSRYNRLLKTLKDMGPDEVLELYLTALSHVYDPHSDYMGRAQLENFAISMKLSLSGIGAVLTMEDDYCKIQELKEGPAQKSKQIKAGDRIVAVGQDDKEPVDCVGMKLNKVVEMIRGPKGTKVKLTILPVDASDPSVRKTVVLVRDDIKLEDQEAKAKVIDMPAANGKMIRVGVLDLPSFYEDMDGNRLADHKSTSADIRKLLKKLNEEKVSGIILDLRRNGGGALSEAIKLTGLFIKDGPVVQTKDPNGRIEVKSDRDSSVAYNGPLIVLTSRFSASASEILAGALQDYGRALIVGDSSTHGKGTVQQLLALDPAQLERLDCLSKKNAKFGYDPGALKFTIQKFYRAGGSSTQLKGVVPDLVLPSINNYAEIGESSLENPLPWDEVSSAKFEKLHRVEPYLTELKKRSTKRIETDKDFSYIREDIERFKKTLADKTVSLNEQARLKEMDELKAANEARKKERQSRKDSAQTTYEVTLRNADKPGLTLAVAKTNETSTAESSLLSDEIDDDEKNPAVDATLEETKRILADYIALSGKDTPVTVAK